MENVILTVHLILAVLLAGVVLLQRSEGGGLGMGGGGGGGGGVMTGRQAANAMTRLTWIFGVALFCTSIALTILAARQATNGSIMDQFSGAETQEQPEGNLPTLPAYTPPPTTSGNPLTPPAPDAEAPAAATDAPAAEAPAAEAEAPVAPPAAETAPAEAPSEATTDDQPAN
ncbi:preprotein translocase subunit SecG [Paracoccus sp. R86501]|uniref:preprotein translocase subunit SecG n=1 Tax=Paracoccus sp. R86501 TaxID=3101711 RepID=UPI00366A576E